MRAAGKERSAPQTEGARYAAAIFSIALVYEGRQAPVSERKRWRRRKRSVRDVGADGGSRIKAWRGSRRQEPDKGLARQCVCIYTEFLRSDIQKAAAPGCFPQKLDTERKFFSICINVGCGSLSGQGNSSSYASSSGRVGMAACRTYQIGPAKRENAQK